MTSNRLKKLRSLHQSDATWLCTVRRAPFWITPEEQPAYRPFVMLVTDQDTGYIYKTNTFDERPTPEICLEHLFKAMQGTLLTLGRSSRPVHVFVDDAELARVIAPRLAELDVHCSFRASLPQADATLLRLEARMTRRKPLPGLLSIPGVSVPLVAELFAAAADFYRQAPWHWLENWIPIEVRYPPEGRARYALVLGGGGESFGLSLYESLADLDVLFAQTEPDQSFSRPIGWLSVLLDVATAMSFADLDAMEQYHWPVAGEKAYPIVLKATPKNENDWGELPSASELAWLAAAIRMIPDFLTRHLHADSDLPRAAQATYQLAGVHGNQQLMLRYPAQVTPPVTPAPTETSSTHSSASQQNADLQELEDYIQDWHWDDASHEFARQMGAFLFQFLDHLEASGLSRQTMSKHESNCWCIGWLESGYGYHDTFVPDIFLGGPSFLNEFKRKVSDSHYAVNSYKATWRKLERYILSLGYGNDLKSE
jgi:hypothetical protein